VIGKVVPILSEPVLLGVFGFLSVAELCICAHVCKRWAKVSSSDYIWRFLALKRWGVVAVGKGWKKIYSKRHQEEVEHERFLGQDPLKAYLDFALRSEKEKHRDTREYVRKAEGEQMAQSVGAAKYIEISAILGENLRFLFDEAVRASIHQDFSPPIRQKKKKVAPKVAQKVMPEIKYICTFRKTNYNKYKRATTKTIAKEGVRTLPDPQNELLRCSKKESCKMTSSETPPSDFTSNFEVTSESEFETSLFALTWGSISASRGVGAREGAIE